MLSTPALTSSGESLQPRMQLGRHRLAERAELQLERREDLRGLVVQLAGEPAPLLLVLLDHTRGEPFEVLGPGLEPRGQLDAVERGADLLADGDENPVIERGERRRDLGAGDQHHRMGALVHREHGEEGIACRPARAVRSSPRSRSVP